MSDKKLEEIVSYWEDKARLVLTGKRIKAVRYLTEGEASSLGWHSRSVVFELDNGVLVWASADDEGNDAGALFTTDKRVCTLPVI